MDRNRNRNRNRPPCIQVPEFAVSSSSAATTPSTLTAPSSQDSSSSPSVEHATVKYRGSRCRNGKWVSEIREPRKTKRIWLGTFATSEMAAAAYDAAALALKGPDTPLNFPESINSYPVPASLSEVDIIAAASAAAEARLAGVVHENSSSTSGQGSEGNSDQQQQIIDEGERNIISDHHQQQYVDEDELLNMHGLLDDMARGMQVSPPRLPCFCYDDSPENSEGDNLWSY